MNNWKNRTAVVAGGSKGLGLAVAKTLHSHGAHVVILARGEERLQAEVQSLRRLRSGSATGYPVDLLDESGVRQAAANAASIHGQIDIWVNAVGESTRVLFSEATPQLYRRLMDHNFFTAVNGTYGALEFLARSGGHLVNIGSLASRTGWPYIAPYVTSKHALAGFTSQLRLEGPANVHYLFVCPGPIASDSSSDRYELSERMPKQVAQPGAGAPVNLIDPDWLARKIVKACERRKPELIVPAKTRILFGLLQFWPTLGQALLKRVARKSAS